MMRIDQRRAVAHYLVDRLHDVGIGTEGQRAAACVQPNTHVARGRDGLLDIRTRLARGMEVVLVGDGRHPPSNDSVSTAVAIARTCSGSNRPACHHCLTIAPRPASHGPIGARSSDGIARVAPW